MLLKGKKAIIFGMANNKSIAYGIAQSFARHGASLCFNYLNDTLKKRVEPLAEELSADFIFPCDISNQDELDAAFELVKKEWSSVDIIVHSIAFAKKEELSGRYLDTSPDGFSIALDISAYSFTKIIKSFENLLSDKASLITLSYYGAEKWVKYYNVMGVAKAALESSIRYLAVDLGSRQIRVNGISAGPIKTLAASGISNFNAILQRSAELAPLQRNVTQEEVGDAATFLASDLARGVTGEILHVDGGYNIIGL
ncbi:MAG: enoyl-ACP reductase FabI [Desulfovibrionaceae bacterium]